MNKMNILFSKGLSEVVAIVLAFSIISFSILYIITSMPRPIQLDVKPISDRLKSYASEDVIIYPLSNSSWAILNTGSISINISYIVTFDNNLNKIILNPMKNSNRCTISGMTIVPGKSIEITCSNEYKLVSVITQSGRVFSIDPQLYISQQRQLGIPMIPLLPISLSTSSLALYLSDPQILNRNSINTTIPLQLKLNRTGEISITGDISASMVFVGRNPINNKLNVLIIGRGTSGSSLSIEGQNIDMGRIAAFRYRLRIENFTGTLKIRGSDALPGIYPCYINTDTLCSVNINGRADRVTLYTNTSNIVNSVIGLDPYIFIGDLDNNNSTEIVFATQDFSVGDRLKINDVLTISGKQYLYLDSTVSPIRLVFSQRPIDNKLYRTAVLSLRFFYWDNSVDDISDNDNRIIMRIGIYDIESEMFAYSVYLSYYELCRYRGVKPFTYSYIAKDFVLYVPHPDEVGRKTYYIALELYDPYSNSGNKNDADFIIGLEYIGIFLG